MICYPRAPRRISLALCALVGACADAEPWSTQAQAFAAAVALPAPSAWPGSDTLVPIDVAGSFAQNLSGLSYQPAIEGLPAVLWALQNAPSRLLRLSPDGPRPGVPQDGGRELLFPTGRGSPDAEGLALLLDAEGARFAYVVSERANENFTSRLSVLRFDTRAPGSRLTATHEWNLTADLPRVGGNAGLEGLAFVGDDALRAAMYDEASGSAYAPARYGAHAGGVFFVGVEQTGMIYGYVLDHEDGGFQRIATVETGLAGVMALEYDADDHALWAYCDDTCGNRAVLLRLADDASDAPRRFVPKRVLERPRSMPNVNNEGIAMAPDAACRDGEKSFFWATDGALDGHAVRRGSIACGDRGRLGR